MVKILIFFVLLVLCSYGLTSVLVFFPLDLIKNLESALGYVPIAVGILLLLWIMGDE
jgi:hypothetical protein